MVNILIVVTMAAKEATIDVLVIVLGSILGVFTSASCGLKIL